MKAIVAMLMASFVFSAADDIPENFKVCKRNDPNYSKCLDGAVITAIGLLAKGLRKFQILPMEPLDIESISIGEIDGPVSLKQEYHNVQLHGITKGIKVKHTNVDLGKLSMTLDTYNPQIELVGDYKIKGQVLVLPIRGEGRSNITMVDMKAKNTIYFEKYEKDGENYLKVTKYDIKFTPGSVIIDFDNLFDGDKTLGKQTNAFMNENWELLFKELLPPFEETFGLLFKNICNQFYSRIPMNKLFPEE